MYLYPCSSFIFYSKLIEIVSIADSYSSTNIAFARGAKSTVYVYFDDINLMMKKQNSDRGEKTIG